ncbi:hypothetical protein L6Q21_16105 [Sandaracinobacter sp. RS1-74]|uniref:hypothetical protein n=1 Tax=Sandaracinobacteroides sayramensis TaxID=2913411 RepID=UPI001EDB97CF|nr:hypothetical protein [Sandaracinobacteroides sayramensis]MCG2842502.1 hypothetical protein [Sandaracinobacteroides sayramensis]
MTAIHIHPETGKVLKRGVRPQEVAFGLLSRTIEMPGWYPDDDSDSIHDGADLAEADRVFRELKATSQS